MPNFNKMRSYSTANLVAATNLGLMYGVFDARIRNRLRVQGRDVVSYVNCSYLGFDTDASMVGVASDTLRRFGLHYCCARSRLSIAPLAELEAALTRLFGAPAITFPSVTAAHAGVLPLVASGTILDGGRSASHTGRVHLIYDRFAHASMQILRDQLARHASISTIEHNDIVQLRREIDKAGAAGSHCVYLADSVYSMGGVAPIADLLPLLRHRHFSLYMDDAHGTSVYGKRGEGYVVSQLQKSGRRHGTGKWPRRLFITFSLAKGFGCNGGGIVVPNQHVEQIVRQCAPNYLFSGPLDFAMTGAALKCIEYHLNGQVQKRQAALRRRVALLDRELFDGPCESFSPIRMVCIGREREAIRIGARLLNMGHYVPVVFFPVVPRGQAQLRICITVQHSPAQILKLCRDLISILGEKPRWKSQPFLGVL